MAVKLADWFSPNGQLTVAARASLLAFAVVGLFCAPIVTWFAKGAYDEFKGQSQKLSEIERYMAGAAERAKQRDIRADQAEAMNRSQQGQLDDHERRLIRIETLREARP